MKEFVAVTAGGNSIIKDNASQSIEHRAEVVKTVADAVLEILASDYSIALTHSNGPQVGLDLWRAKIVYEREGSPLTPPVNYVANTQGGIDYLTQQVPNNRLVRRDEQRVVTVVTQTKVDRNDPSSASPTKPVGAFFSEVQCDESQRVNPDQCLAEGPERGYRRVVASSQPKRVVEAEVTKTLAQQGFAVIGAGGGGIPVARSDQGDYQSVGAVIDKNSFTALLAQEIRTNILVITTGAEQVCIHFGKPNQQALNTVDVATMTCYIQEEHFPSGSVLPKIVTGLASLERNGKRVIITTPECLPTVLHGEAGTHIVHSREETRMKGSNSRREFLSQGGGMVIAVTLLGVAIPIAYAIDPVENTCGSKSAVMINDKHYYLDNVLLETGFDYENSVVVHTCTTLQTVEIEDGKIVALRENRRHSDAALPHYDAGGKLMLPAMRDIHIHLDRTFYDGPWCSLNRPAGTTIQNMIRLEQKLLPELQPYTQECAKKLIDLL